MLAYIFWHYRSPHVDKSTYHERLIDFHQTLQAHKPGGFLYSAVFQIAGAPWIADGAEAYEDWYLVENSAALDVLNEAAVDARRRSAHDLVAHDAARGMGGLYRLQSGANDLSRVRTALWFAKPVGMSYETLYRTLEPQIQQEGAALWRRQMVLGSAHEFCWHSPENSLLPANFAGLQVPQALLWCGR
jgi:hypothetical protein